MVASVEQDSLDRRMNMIRDIIKVAVLDDHQSVIDGYAYRLAESRRIRVVASAAYGQDLLPMLHQHEPDVLVLDLTVPTSPDNQNPFPVLTLLPQIRFKFPDLAVLVISMHAAPALIRAVMRAGAQGYVLKDDVQRIQALHRVVIDVAHGRHSFSPAVEDVQKQTRVLPLTERQLELLSLLVAYPDMTLAEVARRQHVAHSTVRNMLSDAYRRLGVRTRAAALAEVQRLGLLPFMP
jgi:two-component system response regulator DesR